MRKLTSGFLVVVCFLSALTVAGCNGGTSSASTNPSPVTIALSTPSGTKEVGEGQSVTITATLSHDSSNQGVTWSMTGAGALSNHTPASVMFTAPANISSSTSATITATSVAQPAATAQVTLTVNPRPGPLTVTTTSLPDGTVGLPYPGTLQASGGSSPYTWSISSGSLPSWANLSWSSAASSTASIVGVPDAAGTASFTVKVTDSGTPPASATQALTLTTPQPDSSNNAALKGQYAFQLQGFELETGNQFAMVGSFIADGNGNITSGIEDVNGPGGYHEGLAFTGTYNVGSDNRGLATFATPLGNTQYALALGSLENSAATRGSLIEFDPDNLCGAWCPAGERGSGFLFLQNPNTFSLAHINGQYAFLFAGQMQQTGTRLALAGAYTADGNGNVTNGQADSNTNGAMSSQTFTASISTDENTALFGRVTYTPAGIPFHFVYYIVTDERTLAMSTDPESPSGLVAGQALAQRSTPYSAASLSGTAVGYGVGQLAVSTGLWSFDGLGTAMYSLARSDAQFIYPEPQTGSLSYTADANGRVWTAGGSVAPGVPGAPIFYLVDTNKGFLLSTDASVSTGFFEPQTGGPFSNASLSGSYFIGTVPPAVSSSTVVSGSGTSAGDGTLNITVDEAPLTRETKVLNFAISPDGHGQDQDPSVSAILYMISPKRIVVMLNGPDWPMITVLQQ